MERVESLDVAATQPHAMVNDAGDVFYPDGPEDAAEFAAEHGARFLNPTFQWGDAEETEAPPRATTDESQAQTTENLRS